MAVENQQRVIVLLIGLATVTAGVLGWHSGQIGSAAAFDDRQSVGQTVLQQEQQIQVALGLVSDINTYITYVADFLEAQELDRSADVITEQGRADLAPAFSTDAIDLRNFSTARSAARGLFGLQTLYAEFADPGTDPLPFDTELQLERLETEATTGFTSPGVLEPDRWADKADAIRAQNRGIRRGVLVIILAVVLLTIAQMTNTARTRLVAGSAGFVVFAVASVVTVVNFW